MVDFADLNFGLTLPDTEELNLMAQSPVYPEGRMLDDKDIQKGLAGDWYLESRKRLAPYMINQNPLGKCNASALKGGFEQIRMDQGFPYVNLSDNDAYMQMNRGVDQGSALIRAFEVAQQRGVSSRIVNVNGQQYTIPLDIYNPRKLPPGVAAACTKDAARFRGWEWYRAPRDFASFARCLASELARHNPVVFAWDVSSASMKLRNGYVQTGRGKGNHANVFHSAKWVGGKDLVHPDNRNSWGPSQSPEFGRPGQSWGEAGYALFTMEQAFACNQWHDTYIITSAKPDHQDQFLRT